jgi:uncharacterized peroxidase-related enzyme
MGLKLVHLPANSRQRHAQRSARSGETPRFNHPQQDCHGLEPIHDYPAQQEPDSQTYLIILLDETAYVSHETNRFLVRHPRRRTSMSRLAIPAPADVPEAAKPILDAVRKQLGVVPNMFRLIASSPAALQGFTANNGALARTLDVRTRERIALAVAQINGCDYCLSAHTYLGLNLAKITPQEVALNRQGESGDAKADAAVRFAARLVREHGHVTEADIKSVRDRGFTDSQIVEIIAVVAENIFTNMLNVVAETDIDFPVVRAADAT